MVVIKNHKEKTYYWIEREKLWRAKYIGRQNRPWEVIRVSFSFLINALGDHVLGGDKRLLNMLQDEKIYKFSQGENGTLKYRGVE
jgi:hypothetical protein